MKINCEKCGKDLTIEVSQKLERHMVGKVVCPHCQKKQQRYISKADLLIYLLSMEIIYFILALVTSILFKTYGFGFITILIPIIMMVLSIILIIRIRTIIYIKGIFKEKTMFNVQKENAQDISKSMRTKFMVMYGMLIILIMQQTMIWLYALIAFAGIIVTVIDLKITLKKEK